MNMARWADNIVDGGGGVVGGIVRIPLWFAARIYGRIITARNARFDRGGDAVRRVSVPVVSIGNITTGGTGKSPMAIDVVQRLQSMGRNPAVVSRGYASGRGESDELTMISKAVPRMPCIANPDRVAGAEEAIIGHSADVIVLDDGFQHRRIARDLDLVLIDATYPLERADMLPCGRLREPLDQLARADAIILTRCDQVAPDQLARQREQLNRYVTTQPILACRHQPIGLKPLHSPQSEANSITSSKLMLVSGIARPDAFEQTVRAQGGDVREHLRYVDHHRYTESDARRMTEVAQRAKVDRIVTTEKDAVKLARVRYDWPIPVDVLTVRIDFEANDDSILNELLKKTLDHQL